MLTLILIFAGFLFLAVFSAIIDVLTRHTVRQFDWCATFDDYDLGPELREVAARKTLELNLA